MTLRRTGGRSAAIPTREKISEFMGEMLRRHGGKSRSLKQIAKGELAKSSKKKSAVGRIPAMIPIRREKGYHTHYLGKAGNGDQFMAFVVATHSPRRTAASGRLRWYAVVHRFSDKGKYLDTNALFLGFAEFASELDKPTSELRKMLRKLGRIAYGDVRVCPFKAKIDGCLFGLVKSSARSAGGPRVDLLPNALSFFPPWDGTYET